MERRKRTRTATAKVVENNYIEASQRRTRRTRRTAPGLPEDEHEAASGGYAEAHSALDKAAVLEQINVAGEAGPAGSGLVAESNLGPKQETQEEDITPADGQLCGGESMGKKRRKVGATSQDAQEAQENDARNVAPQSPNIEEKIEISRRPREQEETSDLADVADGERATQDGNGSAKSGSPIDRSHQQNGSNTVSFTSGVELPIQPNKRKDIHTGSGAEIGSGPLSAELTPKRPRRSANRDTSTNNMQSKQDSPHKGATNRKEKGNRASPAKANVAAAELPAYSTRRRAQVTYKEVSDDEEDYESQSAPARGNSPPPKAAASRSNKRGKGGAGDQDTVGQSSPKARKGRKGIWDKEVLLTSKKSRLAKAADLSDVLNSATWDLLSPEEQIECLALLPTIDKVYGLADPRNPNADPNGEAILAPDFFDSNQVFKDSLVEFQDDLSQGRYEPSYIAEAAKARKARLEGAVDKYKDGQFELFWGQRQLFGMIAGAAANIKLPELIQRGLLKSGDIWAYKRTFWGVITLEKEVRVAQVTNDGGKYSLVFHIPPGKLKFSKQGIDDIVLHGVVSPQTLETVILKTHPNTPDRVPNGNSFKVFNILRNGEDLGLLWEIRQTYWGGE